MYKKNASPEDGSVQEPASQEPDEDQEMVSMSTLSIFYKRQPENVTRVSLKFFKNLPSSVSKSVS